MKKQSAAHARTRIAIGILMALGAGSASAIEFEVGDGWKGAWNTTIGFAQGWRAQAQDPRLFREAGRPRRRQDQRPGRNEHRLRQPELRPRRYDLPGVQAHLRSGHLEEWHRRADPVQGLVRQRAGQQQRAVSATAASDPRYTPGQPLSDEGLAMENRFLRHQAAGRLCVHRIQGRREPAAGAPRQPGGQLGREPVPAGDQLHQPDRPAWPCAAARAPRSRNSCCRCRLCTPTSACPTANRWRPTISCSGSAR